MESAVSRYGVDAVSDLPASQSNQQTSALGGTTSRSVINWFVRLFVV